MPIDTKLNQTPFFDDFDESKKYHRILFRPAVPVQARELTQLQTILQNQIERFGDHVFIEGSIIKGCTFTFDREYHFAKILDLTADGIDVNLENYNNTYIVDTTTGLKGVVVNTVSGLQSSETGDYNTLYFKYLNVGTASEKKFANNKTLTIFARNYSIQKVVVTEGGSAYSNGDLVTFTSVNGEGSGAAGYIITTGDGTGAIKEVVLTSGGSNYTTAPTANVVYKLDGNTATTGTGAVLTPRNYIDRVFTPTTEQSAPTGAPVGTGYALTISDGVIYQKGNFIQVDAQSTIVSKYDLSPNNVVVGFRTIESIANNATDPSLNDNAAGFTNANAPGAFRLKLEPQLVTLSKTAAAANNEFFTLVEFENGQPVRQNQKAAYSEINGELARRTFEESGNYVVRKFNVMTEDHPTDLQKLNAVIGAGLGYIDGYRVELFDNIRVPFSKANTTSTIRTATVSTNFGNYVFVNQVKGLFNMNTPVQVNLRDTAGLSYTSVGGTPGTPGAVIGTARVRGFEYHSGTPGTASAVYKLYLFNISLNAGQVFDNVRSITVDGTAISDVVLSYQATTNTNIAVIQEPSFVSGVFDTGSFAVSALDDEDYFIRTSVDGLTVYANGYTSVSLSSPLSLPYGVGALNDEQRSDLVFVVKTGTVGSARTGTVSGNTTSPVVNGSSTSFLSQYRDGDYINIGGTQTAQIARIISNSQLELSATPGAAFSGNTHARAFPNNTIVSLGSRVGALHSNVAVSAVSNTQLTVNLGETLSSTMTGFITTNARVANYAREKTITKNAYVKLAAADLAAKANGPWSLGLPDVHKIVGVFKSSNTSVYDEAVDVTSNFILDNGQRDSHYGLAKLQKMPGSVLSLDGTFNLVVKLNVFQHGSGGYFTVESYPTSNTVGGSNTTITWAEIPSYTSSLGTKYDLRDCLDTRVVASNTAVVTTNLASANIVSQSAVETFPASVVLPAPNEQFTADVTRHLPRRDLIVIDKSGRVSVIEGVSSSNPAEPPAPTGTITLATMTVPPFPTVASSNTSIKLPQYTTSVSVRQNKRYTMKDIERLDNKITQLQYYSLLTTLEQETKGRVIPSESDSAIERFKNGFFADPLLDYSFVDNGSAEKRIAIDTTRGVATPLFEQGKFDLKMNAGASTNVVRKGDIALLNYSSRSLISQPVASRYRNPVQNQWKYSGAMFISPAYDNYVSTTTNPVVLDLATPLNDVINTITEGVNDVFEQYHLNEKTVTTVSTVQTGGGRGWASYLDTYSANTSWNYLQLSFEDNQKIVSNVGSFVTDLSLNPYMKGRPITFVASGLRPGTRHYVFFDEKDVNAYVAPGKLADSFTNNRRATADDVVITGLQGAELRTNDAGIAAGIFYLPDNMFFVGERELLIVDVDSYSSIDTSTSRCLTKYNAFNLNVSKGNLTMTTVDAGGAFVQNIATSNTVVTTASRTVTWDADDPLAQTFLLSNEIARNQDGLYMTEVDLYFKQKDQVFGIVVEVRTVELGVPTRTRIGSKRLAPNQVNVSNNATAVTTVVFDTPVYLKADQEYAIVLIPEAYTPEYLVWTGAAGENDVTNPEAVKVQDWNQGAMFLSTNGTAWTPFQNEDVKLNIKFAEFNNSVPGSLVLSNDDREFLTLGATSGSLIVGEPVGMLGNTYVEKSFSNVSISNTAIIASGDVSTELLAGDYVVLVKDSGTITNFGFTCNTYGNTTVTLSAAHANAVAVGNYVVVGNNAIRKVTALTNSTAFAVDKNIVAATGQSAHKVVPEFDVAKVVSVSTSTVNLNKFPKFASSNTNAVYAIKAVAGIVDFISANGSSVHIRESNAADSNFRFAAANTFVGALSNTIATIASVDNPGISYFDTLVTAITHPGTAVSANASYTAATDTLGNTSTMSIHLNTSNDLAVEGMVRSRSNEVAISGSPKSFGLTLSLGSESSFNSPAINMAPASILRYKYKVSNTSVGTVGETERQGSSLAKYVSKPIVLADGQEGEDLRVYVSAYKPLGTSIAVYARVLNETDNAAFYDKDWTLLTLVSGDTYSSSSNKSDFKEFEYTFPSQPVSTELASRVITYSNTTVSTNSTDLSGTISAGDLVVLVNPANTSAYGVKTVTSVNSTAIIVSSNVSFSNSGVVIKKVTQPNGAYKNYEDGSGIVTYYNGALGNYVGFKTMAVKVVMMADSYAVVPRLDDVRAIACSV